MDGRVCVFCQPPPPPIVQSGRPEWAADENTWRESIVVSVDGKDGGYTVTIPPPLNLGRLGKRR